MAGGGTKKASYFILLVFWFSVNLGSLSLKMEPDEAVRDHQQRVHALARRRGCPLMVAWGIARNDPATLATAHVRPVSRLASSRVASHLKPCIGGSGCALCLDAMDADAEVTVFSPCDHAVHGACGAAMADAYCAQGKPLPFACPQCARGVMVAIPPAVATMMASPLALPSAYAPCPKAGCGRLVPLFFAMVPLKSATVECSACATRFCHTCRGAPHGKTACAAAVKLSDALEELRADLDVIDAVPMDALRKQMVTQYAFAFGSRMLLKERWLYMESRTLPETQLAATLLAEKRRVVPPDAELIETARQLLLPPPPLVSNHASAVATVLDDALAKLPVRRFEHEGEDDAAETSKFCPFCFTRIVRIDGCNSVKCGAPACGRSFCYMCLGVHTGGVGCTKVVDRGKLREAAARAGVAPAVVDRLALFSDEFETFDDVIRTNLSNTREHENMLRWKRVARLTPLLAATERLEAYLAPDVRAPTKLVEAARQAVLDAVAADLARADALQANYDGFVAENQTVLDGFAVASKQIATYAEMRVTIAKERLRHAFIGVQRSAVVTLYEKKCKALAPLLGFAADWMAPAGAPRASAASLAMDGRARALLPESNSVLGYVKTADKKVPAAVALPASLFACARAQPGQFGESALARARTTIGGLLTRLHAEAAEAAREAMLSSPEVGERALVAADVAPLRVGDVVVRGPAWNGSEQDGGAGNHGLVRAYESNVVSVQWWLIGGSTAGGGYTYPFSNVVRASDWHGVGVGWRNLTRELDGLPLSREGRRLRSRLDAVFSEGPPPSPFSGLEAELTKNVDASLFLAMDALRKTYLVSPPPPPPQEPKRQDQQVSPPKTWNCPKCTFINNIAQNRCEMCEHLHDTSASVEPIPPLPQHASSAAGDAALARLVLALLN